MADSDDIRGLDFYFTEVSESEIKTVLSIQCIKAQSALINKLRKQAAHQKEICNLISIGNVKLNAEIKFAEQEIANIIISLNTIKHGNIDLRKEMLLKKEQNSGILKRIELGNKKYEDLWQSSKSRYENIPYVQKCLQGRNKIKLIERNINDLQKESANLVDSINKKRNTIIITDKKLVIDLAKFLVIEHPKIMEMIYISMNEIQELSKIPNSLEEQTVLKNHLAQFETVNIKSDAYIEKTTHEMEVDDSLSKNNNEKMVMQKPHLLGADFDIFGVKLDRIKKGDIFKEQCKSTITELNKTKDLGCSRKDEHILSNYTSMFAKQNKTKNYSKRKLIHILDNVELDNNQSRKIISEVNPFHFYGVNFITPEGSKSDLSLENKVNESSEDKTEIDHNTEKEILVPPTQSLDEKKNIQEKKKVTFVESMDTIADEYAEGVNNESNNITIEDNKSNGNNNSQNDNSTSDDDHIKMKDKILKEHNLDSSPQFVYAKHSMLQKKSDDKVITSKFFDSKCDNVSETNVKVEERQEQEHKVIDPSKISVNNVSTEKTNQELHKKERPITGFLFSHGSQGISDSLNLSDSTAGFEDGDYPHCLDSSVFLSPKGDVPVEMGNDNIQNEHQDVPNFMSGLHKATSLFRWSSADSKPSTSTDKTKGNFNFNFNSEEKKKRGELFSMFYK